MPRFVVLIHECPPSYSRPSHWDFMLESAGVLRTWALAEMPDSQTAAASFIFAEQLPDHRLAYLDFEGPISDDRGSVTRWDAGEYELLRETAGEIVVELVGSKLSGEWKLQKPSHGSTQWLFRPI